MAQVELTEQELKDLTAKREAASKQQAEHIQRAKDDRRKALRILTRHIDAVTNMAEALIEADTTNIFTITWLDQEDKHKHGDKLYKIPQVSFQLGERTVEINIAEHISSGYGHRGSSNNGYKYELYGTVTDFKHLRYKKASSLVRKAASLIDTLDRDRQVAKVKQNLNAAAETALRVKYPNATNITFEREFLTKRMGHRAAKYKPNRITVSSEKGSITFTYSTNENGVIVYRVYSRTIDQSISDTVTALILE